MISCFFCHLLCSIISSRLSRLEEWREKWQNEVDAQQQCFCFWCAKWSFCSQSLQLQGYQQRSLALFVPRCFFTSLLTNGMCLSSPVSKQSAKHRLRLRQSKTMRCAFVCAPCAFPRNEFLMRYAGPLQRGDLEFKTVPASRCNGLRLRIRHGVMVSWHIWLIEGWSSCCEAETLQKNREG